MSLIRRIGIGTLITAAAGAGGFWAHHLLQKPASPVAATSSQAPRPASRAALTALPDVTLPDLTGKARSLSEWRSRPLLINFWATWCEPCRREIPLLRQLRTEHAREGLEVVGIALDFHDAVQAYARQAGIDYPVLIAEQDAMIGPAFGVGMGLPTTIVADREGRIVGTHVGELRASQAQELLRLALDKP